MKMTVLDGFTLNPGDNPWDEIADLGHLTVHERTAKDDVFKRASGAEVLFTNKTVLNAKMIKALKANGLRLICVLATGYNIVDVDAAADEGIPVCNVPTYGTDSVAQLVFALILEHCHNVRRHSDSVMEGMWAKNPDYSYWHSPLIELANKTIGIVGYGAIGRKTAQIGKAFGMNIVANDPFISDRTVLEGMQLMDLEELLRVSDFISLHCPLFPENVGMINKQTINLMKQSAFLVNTARGPLVDELALAEALNNGAIAGAGLDVLAHEPARSDNPLLKAKNIIITPHIAWATLEARKRLMAIAAKNVKAYLVGELINVVNEVK